MRKKIKRRQWRVEHRPDEITEGGPTWVELIFLADSKAEATEHLNHCFGPAGWKWGSLKMIGWGEDYA